MLLVKLCLWLSLMKVLVLMMTHFGFSLEDVIDIRNNYLLESEKNRPGGLVVYFGPTDVSEEHKAANPQVFNFVKILDKTSEALSEFGIQVAMVHCSKKTISEFIDCDLQRPKVVVFNKQDREDIDLDVLFDEDAAVGHILFSMFKDEVNLAQSQDDWDFIMTKNRNNADVILCYVRGLGDKSHRYFMEVAFVYGKEYKFVLTTERTMPGVKNLGTDENFGLWYYYCKSTDDCTATKFSGTPKNVLSLVTFIKLQAIPKVLIADNSGQCELDDMRLKLPITRVYVFPVHGQKESTEAMLNELETSHNASIRYIIIHGDNIEELNGKFGISPSSSLPTLVLELTDYQGIDEEHYEQWPLYTEFNKENIQTFINDYMTNPAIKQQENVDAVSIVYTTIEQWKIPKDGMVIAGGCMDEISECLKFNVIFRRLARSFYRASIIYRAGMYNIAFQYVDFTGRPKDAKLNKLPGIRLYRTLKNGTNEEIEFEGKLDYKEMLKFLEDELKVSVFPLPMSVSDHISIFPEDRDDGRTDQSDFDDDDSEMLQKQEDEVAKEASYRKKIGIKDENVAELNDKTFGEMKNKYDLLVVLFYMPWCPRSLSLREPYARVAEKIANNTAENLISTSMNKVDCHNWPDVCQATNINVYPLIKIFRKDFGSHLYIGPLEEQSILKAIRLYQAPLLTKLTSEDEVKDFVAGKIPVPAANVNPASIVGLFPSEDSKEFKIFRNTAEDQFGRYLFGYATGKLAKQGAKAIKTILPVVALKHHYDSTEDIPNSISFDVKSRDFANLKRFVEERCLPFFGELTALNFPSYRRFDKPFVILFKYKYNITRLEDLLIEMSRKMSKSAFFTWMDMDNEVNRRIKEAYIGSDAVPAMVLVAHKKGKVYKYEGGAVEETINEWLRASYNGREKVAATFKDHVWKPLREGYDFLKLIDEGKRSANDDKDKEEADQEEGELPKDFQEENVQPSGDADDSKEPEDDSDEEKSEHGSRLKRPKKNVQADDKKHVEL